jgi:hypothetical protein
MDGSTSQEEEEEMKVWYRGAALAGAVLLWAGAQVGAQIRETVGLPPKPVDGRGVVERASHPVVLLQTRAGEFEGGERSVSYLMLQRLEPADAVGRVSPPRGVDGIIAYPGSRLLVLRGTKEAVAGYRASLEKLDRAPGEAGGPAKAVSTAQGPPSLTLPEGANLGLKADQVERAGDVTRATGHVVLSLGNGIELHADRVRVRKSEAGQEIVIEK